MASYLWASAYAYNGINNAESTSYTVNIRRKSGSGLSSSSTAISSGTVFERGTLADITYNGMIYTNIIYNGYNDYYIAKRYAVALDETYYINIKATGTSSNLYGSPNNTNTSNITSIAQNTILKLLSTKMLPNLEGGVADSPSSGRSWIVLYENGTTKKVGHVMPNGYTQLYSASITLFINNSATTPQTFSSCSLTWSITETEGKWLQNILWIKFATGWEQIGENVNQPYIINDPSLNNHNFQICFPYYQSGFCYSNIITFTYESPINPPSNLTRTPSAGYSFNFSWTPASYKDGYTGILEHYFFVDGEKITDNLGSTATSYTYNVPLNKFEDYTIHDAYIQAVFPEYEEELVSNTVSFVYVAPKNTLHYYNENNEWQCCYVYYYNGTNWEPCIAYYYDGEWKQCQ